jgi:hypothetical protein
VLRHIAIVSIFAAGPTLACQAVSSPSRATLARADRAEQREIIRALAVEAEAIYIGVAVNETEHGERAEFAISHVIKGSTLVQPIVTFDGPTEYTIGCTAAAAFRNALVEVGKSYLIYVAGGRLLRTGLKDREPAEISWNEEMRILRRAIARDKSLKRTRARCCTRPIPQRAGRTSAQPLGGYTFSLVHR